MEWMSDVIDACWGFPGSSCSKPTDSVSAQPVNKGSHTDTPVMLFRTPRVKWRASKSPSRKWKLDLHQNFCWQCRTSEFWRECFSTWNPISKLSGKSDSGIMTFLHLQGLSLPIMYCSFIIEENNSNKRKRGIPGRRSAQQGRKGGARTACAAGLEESSAL